MRGRSGRWMLLGSARQHKMREGRSEMVLVADQAVNVEGKDKWTSFTVCIALNISRLIMY